MDPKRTLRGVGSPSPSPTAAAGPAKRPGLGDAIDQLGREIRQLRIDFERFFSGNLPLPPEELRNRIQTQIRNLRNGNQGTVTAVDSFRLGDLEARFNSYNELFMRRLRDQEEGRHHHAARPVPAAPPRYDPEKGILFGDRVDPEAVEALYQRLAATPGEGPRFDLDSFQTYLARQAAAIREKTGCAEVQFRLATEDGKVKLKARPVQSPSGS